MLKHDLGNFKKTFKWVIWKSSENQLVSACQKCTLSCLGEFLIGLMMRHPLQTDFIAKKKIFEMTPMLVSCCEIKGSTDTEALSLKKLTVDEYIVMNL
jgi:hypothetical protein